MTSALTTSAVVRAARALTRAGQWDEALTLLGCLPESADTLTATAEVMVDRDFWTGADDATAALHRLEGEDSWGPRMLRARAEYTTQLRTRLAGGSPVVAPLAATLQGLLDDTDDPRSQAQAHFYLGVVAEVLAGEPDDAATHYRAVLDGPDRSFDAEALRHLGGHAQDTGDVEQARRLWLQSLQLRQRTGHLPGALAQLLLLAYQPLPTVVQGWAAELGSPMLHRMATMVD